MCRARWRGRRAIKECLRIARTRPKPCHALFAPVTKRKKGRKLYQSLDPYYLWKQVKRVADKVGLDMTVHMFRHTFAQLYHESGASQPEVQGALGHKSGATTRLYLDRLAPRSARAGRAVQEMLRGLEERVLELSKEEVGLVFYWLNTMAYDSWECRPWLEICWAPDDSTFAVCRLCRRIRNYLEHVSEEER